MALLSCQICKKQDLEKVVDGATKTGPWAYMCEGCHTKMGYGFGIGKGQLLQFDPKSQQYKVIKGGIEDEVRGKVTDTI